MYSQQDLDDAVAAGALAASDAQALRRFVDTRRASPSTDEEQVRLITGFNDIFVTIACVVLFVALGSLGQSLGVRLGFAIDGDGPSALAPFLIALAAWGLADFFTAKRRMALPSIVLLLAFVGSVFGTVALTGMTLAGDAVSDGNAVGNFIASGAGIVALGAAWVHWRRFHVPITVAAGAGSVAVTLIALIAAAVGKAEQGHDILLALTFVAGLGIFLYAMRWDGSDRTRTTRRADVAFWLHLLAAPMLVHPAFSLLGLNSGQVSTGGALLAVLLYVLLGLAALAIDRRALLVSALIYVGYALNSLFERFGAVEFKVALAGLLIGSALLTLSAFWHQARVLVVGPLPGGLKQRLPTLDRVALLAA